MIIRRKIKFSDMPIYIKQLIRKNKKINKKINNESKKQKIVKKKNCMN